MLLGIEHFLAMLPATILVPILINSQFHSEVHADLIDVSLVIFASGVGTLLFLILTKGRISAYLGSSFAYIGFTIFLIQSMTNSDVTPQMAFSYVGWSYIFGGTFLLILSILYKVKSITKMLNAALPATIVGPAISLIGLELIVVTTPESSFQSGDYKLVIVAVLTLAVIIIMSLVRQKVLKNMAIIVGMFVGSALALYWGMFPLDFLQAPLIQPPNFSLPLFELPPNLFMLFLSVIPVSLVVFAESTSRTAIITRMKDPTLSSQSLFTGQTLTTYRQSLFAHGAASMMVTALGSVPNTIYAENTAVMGLHNSSESNRDKLLNDPDGFIRQLYNPLSCIPYIIAAIIAIAISFIGTLQFFLVDIPKPVQDGVALFLFGLIAAPGIQMLIDQRADYRKTSNQILTASVLIAGISGLAIDFTIVELRGMSLGLAVGILLNLFIRFLRWAGKLNEYMSFSELLEMHLRCLPVENLVLSVGDLQRDINRDDAILKANHDHFAGSQIVQGFSISRIDAKDALQVLSGRSDHLMIDGVSISGDVMKGLIESSSIVTLSNKLEQPVLNIQKTSKSRYLRIDKRGISREKMEEYSNDYDDIVQEANGDLRILLDSYLPERVLRRILSSVEETTANNAIW